ncbi:trigger factor family protein, partial [Senegalimassilia anaerobia]|uniref:trigger factor family protein n=1 Tax=Senegalimassilia anaerobia TaxID=1473216 RepID=UPI003AAE7B34
METKVEALEGNRAKVTITLDAKDVDARIKNTYKEFANKYNFPGFRKGKAPRPIIDNALGKDAVRASVADDVVNGLSPIAIDEKGLFPISKPEFAEEPGLVEDGKEYSYTFTIECKPEVELDSYEPVEIELPGEEATDDEVEDQIEHFREHCFTLKDSPAYPKGKLDSELTIAMKSTDD